MLPGVVGDSGAAEVALLVVPVENPHATPGVGLDPRWGWFFFWWGQRVSRRRPYVPR